MLRIIIENAAAVCYNLSMNSVRVKSYAKINLTLNITGVSDGYHMLDSAVASIDLYDLIVLKKRCDKLISVTMRGRGSESLAYEDNNAARAAEAFLKKFGTCGADITVHKNIPVGAGLGGSSADVAGVLNGMAKLYGTGGDGLKEIADSLGSDCGYMLGGGFARLTGRGERVRRIDSGLKLYMCLAVPKTGVSTGSCYALYDRLNAAYGLTNGVLNDCNGMETALKEGDLRGVCARLNNDLTAAAVKLNPDILKCVEELRSFDPLGVNMTGSGSAVYAVFENEQFASYAKSRYRGGAEIILTKTVVPVKEDKNGRRENH